jgi:hypothetical protein
VQKPTKNVRTNVTKRLKNGEFLHRFRTGDVVKVTDAPSDLKTEDKPDKELRTAEIFCFCVGRQFPIRGFNQYGFCELEVSDDKDVSRRFGKGHTIWIEPHLLKLVEKSRPARRTDSGWKVDFRKTEREFERLKETN